MGKGKGWPANGPTRPYGASPHLGKKHQKDLPSVKAVEIPNCQLHVLTSITTEQGTSNLLQDHLIIQRSIFSM